MAGRFRSFRQPSAELFQFSAPPWPKKDLGRDARTGERMAQVTQMTEHTFRVFE